MKGESMTGPCEKHDGIMDRISDLEGSHSTMSSRINTLEVHTQKNENRINEVSQLHSILAEVKTEIKHINKKLDGRNLKDIIIETVVPAAIIGGILAYFI